MQEKNKFNRLRKKLNIIEDKILVKSNVYNKIKILIRMKSNVI